LAHQAGKSLTFVGSKSDGPDLVDGVAFPKAHEGVGGETLEQMLARFSGTYDYPSLNASIVMLHAGTNNTSAEPPQTAEALVMAAKNIPFRDLAAGQARCVETLNSDGDDDRQASQPPSARQQTLFRSWGPNSNLGCNR